MSTFILFVGYVSILSVSLDTNKIDFNDFNGMEDKEYRNSLNILVESNLPYEVSASLESEIQNKYKTEIMNKSILEIKESLTNSYKNFPNIGDAILLIESEPSSADIQNHSIDFRLKGNIPYKTDVYKAVVKFEVKQK